MPGTIWRWTPIATILLIALACAPADGRAGDVAEELQPSAKAPVIDHVSPRRDSVGGVPKYFEWTRVEGADGYAICIWNEVDVMLWRQNDIRDTRVARPDGLRLEPGTYLWSVTALRGGQSIAESGLAAFIVRTEQ